MDDHILRAERFLKAIALRGQRAKDALAANDWEGFEQSMRWKKAAFHHFLSLDYILQKRDPEYLSHAAWQLLWQEIRNNDRALSAEIEAYQARLHEKLGKLRSNRATLSRFRSGNQEKTGFIESV